MHQVLSSLAPERVEALFSIPTPQAGQPSCFFLLIAFLFTCATGTMSPKITTRTIALARNSVVRGLYTVYSGSAPLALTNVNETSVGIAVTTGVDATMKDEFRKLNAL